MWGELQNASVHVSACVCMQTHAVGGILKFYSVVRDAALPSLMLGCCVRADLSRSFRLRYFPACPAAQTEPSHVGRALCVLSVCGRLVPFGLHRFALFCEV